MKTLHAARVAVAISIGALGCGEGAADTDVEKLTAAVVSTGFSDQSPPGSTAGFITDASGDVQIKIRTCNFPAAATSGMHCSYCELPPGWDLIGGGAEITPANAGLDAKLRGSWPVEDGSDGHTDKNFPSVICSGNTQGGGGQIWQARSDGNSSHRLRAFVIGVRIPGVAGDIVTKDGAAEGAWNDPPSFTPTVQSADAPQALNIVGGGTNEEGDGPTRNCYLTQSIPVPLPFWKGSAICTAASKIGVYHISLATECIMPSDYSWNDCLRVKISLASTSGSGLSTASVTTPWPWVTASIGGSSTGSRYLADLKPLGGNQGGASVTTNGSGIGTTKAYAVSILGGRNGPWMHNQIQFVEDESYFVRESGTQPRNLTQSMTSPPFPPSDGQYRWYVESVGSGQYRIRNSNPSNPASGECVFRDPLKSNLRVGTCQSTDNFKWTVYNAPDINFFVLQLQNVATKTCITSTASGGVSLAPCNNDGEGGSNPQLIHLNQWYWP